MPSVQKDQTTWRKLILIPLWLIRLGLAVSMIGLLSIAIWAISKRDATGFYINGTHFEYAITEDGWRLVTGGIILFLVLFVVIFLLDCLAIIKFCRHNLTPVFLVIVSAIQSAIALAVMIFVIVGGVRAKGIEDVEGAESVGYVFSVPPVIAFLSYFLVLIYSSIKCHRQRRDRKAGYTRTPNPTKESTPSLVAQHANRYEPYRGSFEQTHPNVGYDRQHMVGGEAAGYYHDAPSQTPRHMV